MKIVQKKRFLEFLVFHCIKYFEYISVKTKAFCKFFFIKMLRIKSPTNAENFIEIGDPFCMRVWDSKGQPMRKLDFFTLSYFKKFEVGGWTNYISI